MACNNLLNRWLHSKRAGDSVGFPTSQNFRRKWSWTDLGNGKAWENTCWMEIERSHFARLPARLAGLHTSLGARFCASQGFLEGNHHHSAGGGLRWVCNRRGLGRSFRSKEGGHRIPRRLIAQHDSPNRTQDRYHDRHRSQRCAGASPQHQGGRCTPEGFRTDGSEVPPDRSLAATS